MAQEGLIPCLDRLRFEFNVIAPGRGKASDGWVGDAAHQAEVSDHNWDETGSVPIHDADKVNEVHALDVDSDLRTPGLDMEQVVQFLLGRCRSGAETRLRYVIYNRRIWDYRTGWAQKTYTGASAHTEHAHFSASYETPLEASTASWRLEEIPVPLTADDKTWISDQITAQTAKIWAYKVDVDRSSASNMQPAGSVLAYGSGEHHDITGAVDRVEKRVTDLEDLAQRTYDLLQTLTGVTQPPPPAS